MDHNIKINRAHKLSKWGDNPRTFAACLARVPASVLASITAVALAELIDSIRASHQAGYWQGQQEAA